MGTARRTMTQAKRPILTASVGAIAIALGACAFPADDPAHSSGANPPNEAPVVNSVSIIPEDKDVSDAVVDTEMDNDFRLVFTVESQGGYDAQAYLTRASGGPGTAERKTIMEIRCGALDSDADCKDGVSGLTCLIDRDNGSVSVLCPSNSSEPAALNAFFAATNGLPGSYAVHLEACNAMGCAVGSNVIGFQ